MEMILDFVGEILFEVTIEIIKNKKVSRFVRYPLFLLVVLFYMLLLGMLSYLFFVLADAKKVLPAIIMAISFLLIFVLCCCFFIRLFKNERLSWRTESNDD